MDADFKARLHAMHHVGWSGTWLWVAFISAFLSLEGVLLALLLNGPQTAWQIGLVAVTILLAGQLMHTHLIALHEAAHGLLCPVPRINDSIGRLLGLFSLLSFELYRAAHHTHHAYLATERDEELWPFVKPDSPRWLRCLCAFLELTCGLFYTPCLFLRAYFRRGSVIRNGAVRRRIAIELTVIAGFWTLHVIAASIWDFWIFLLLMYLAPAWIAGCLQSWRKYIEHMGVTGSTALSATRSVQPVGWTGQLVALVLFNEPFHGIHHKYPNLPQEVLPNFAEILTPSREGEMAPFSSYRAALWSMLGSLSDPRVGPASFQANSQQSSNKLNSHIVRA
jgi:fatty acid desaturase